MCCFGQPVSRQGCRRPPGACSTTPRMNYSSVPPFVGDCHQTRFGEKRFSRGCAPASPRPPRQRLPGVADIEFSCGRSGSLASDPQRPLRPPARRAVHSRRDIATYPGFPRCAISRAHSPAVRGRVSRPSEAAPTRRASRSVPGKQGRISPRPSTQAIVNRCGHYSIITPTHCN
jgi:hypothetical protein